MKTPAPGRPQNLDRATDLDAAAAVLSVAAACRRTIRPGRSSSGAARLLREALWFIWEEPRLPRPLVASKYPKPYPWSPAARAVFAQHDGKRLTGGWGLVIEHLYPRELLVADLLDEPEGTKPAEAVELLTERLMGAVVTRDDDRLLPTRAQSARPWRDYASDPWMRYRSAGLHPENFSALP